MLTCKKSSIDLKELGTLPKMPFGVVAKLRPKTSHDVVVPLQQSYNK